MIELAVKVATSLFLVAGAAAGGESAVDVNALVIENASKVCPDVFGEAGTIPDAVVAFQRILRRPDGKAAFKALLKSSNINGQMYALMGLYLADEQTFATASVPYRNRDDEVWFFSGCRGRKVKVSSLLPEIASGALPTRAREEGREKAEGLSRAFGKSTQEELRKSLASSDKDARERAVRYLGSRLEGEQNVEFLIQLLKSGNPRELDAALSALEALGPWGRKAASQLFAVFKKKKVETAWVLARLHPCEDGLPLIRKLLEDRTAGDKALIILVGSLEPFGAKAIPLLQLAAKTGSENVKDAARALLRSIQESGK